MIKSLLLCLVVIGVVLALIVLMEDFIKAIQQDIWLYGARKEPHKYDRCIDCGIMKPHKKMDTNTGRCDDCGLIRGGSDE